MFGATKFGTLKSNHLSTTARRALLAFICVAGLAGGLASASAQSASAQEALDTSKLPRVSGATETFASPATTMFTTKDSVAQTVEAAVKALAALGWQPYVAPFTATADVPNQKMLSLKKGAQALSVYIVVAPAQGNATSVQYSALPVVNDLPFPKDASQTEFDPNRPHLGCLTAGTIDQTLEFFRTELSARGWSLWNAKEGAKQPANSWPGEKTEKGAYAYYVRDQQSERPLILLVSTVADGKTKVELKSIPADVLRAQNQGKPDGPTAEERRADAARIAAAKVEADKSRTASDAMSDAIMKQAEQAISDALKDARAPVRQQPAVTVNTSEPPLKALAETAAPVPLPETADNILYDGYAEDGELKFTSPSSVQAVAAFYSAAMKPLGWTEGRSVINRPNMVVLDFSKSGKKVSLTIVQMGKNSDVSARGDGLAAKTTAKTNTKADAVVATAPIELEAEDKAGLPIPTKRQSSGSTSSPFRTEMNVDVPADLNSVLAFYRRELGKKDWKEEPGAVVKADQAVLTFASADGPAVLKLGRRGDETTVLLTLRRQADATKAGMLPKAGRSKLLFGNVLPAEAVVTINKQTIKVGAGVGTKGPDGPTLDLPPGKYKYSFKAAGGPAKSDEVEIAAGETWGLLIGPGGALTLQVY
ncbi:MAG: hypothetical protein JWN71_1038 [Xanthobacteraceae bacterium]|nr:hypothetical protein [Xanthobacteraceae bacterium]